MLDRARKLALPAAIILLPVAIYLVVRKYFPPLLSSDTLLYSLEAVYQEYGPLIILVAGIVESVYLINLFLPGSIAILLGAALSAKGAISLPEVILLGTTGLLSGYLLDWFVGKKGWLQILKGRKSYDSVESMSQKLKGREGIIIFLCGFHPNALSLAAIAAGISKMSLKMFLIYFGLTQFFWSTFWGVLFYLFGALMLKNIVLTAILAVISILLVYYLYKKVATRLNLLK